MADTLDVKRNGRGSLNNLAVEQELDDLVRQINEKLKQVTGQAKASGLPEPTSITLSKSIITNTELNNEVVKIEELSCSDNQVEFYVTSFYKSGSMKVYLNGLRLRSSDFNEDGNKIISITGQQVISGDTLTVEYIVR